MFISDFVRFISYLSPFSFERNHNHIAGEVKIDSFASIFLAFFNSLRAREIEFGSRRVNIAKEVNSRRPLQPCREKKKNRSFNPFANHTHKPVSLDRDYDGRSHPRDVTRLSRVAKNERSEIDIHSGWKIKGIR